jgi:hypothetical protein
VKPWHGFVVAGAVVGIAALLAMVVGPNFVRGRAPFSLHERYAP